MTGGVKLSGAREGAYAIRPHMLKANAASAAVRGFKADKRSANLAPVIGELRSNGAVTLAQLAAGLDEMGIPAPRGGTWAPIQVSRLIARIKAQALRLSDGDAQEGTCAIQRHTAKVAAAGVSSRQDKAAAYAAELAPVVAELRKAGAGTLNALAAGLNGERIPAPRGGQCSRESKGRRDGGQVGRGAISRRLNPRRHGQGLQHHYRWFAGFVELVHRPGRVQRHRGSRT